MARSWLTAECRCDRIQTLMGHKTVAMTRKYVQTREQGLRDAIAISAVAPFYLVTHW